MQFLRNPNFQFMAYRRQALVLSVVLILVSLAEIGVRGLNFGIDFTGGVLVEVGYSEPVALDSVRGALATGEFGSAIVQYFGTSSTVLIRLAPQAGKESAQIGEAVLNVLRASRPDTDLRRIEFVGPQVGAELAEKGALALLFTLIGIMIYLYIRFEWRLAVGAVAALFHDVIITIGLFSLLGVTFDLTVLAALLAVLGYSVNDTVVIYDRLRETFRSKRKGTPVEIANIAINRTLARTIMTGVTVLLVIFPLILLGGEVLYGFSLALLIGVLVGTYSSIYTASAFALELGLDRVSLMPPKQEEIDRLV